MKERLLSVFRRTFKSEDIDETISQNNYGKWDSLNHLNLAVEIEKEFNIILEPEEIGRIKNFSDAEKIILEKLANDTI